MRILDIDLDLFLSDIALYKADHSRLNDEEYHPWQITRLKQFLENQCLLTGESRIPGKIFTDHVEVFYFWRELIAWGSIETPFEVVHADAHADLGLGDGSYVYIMGELLHVPIQERDDPRRGGYDGILPGNFLTFAIACHWISRLTYVHHERGGDDLPYSHFKDFDTKSGVIELKCCKPSFEKGNLMNLDYDIVLKREPEVPFALFSVDKYQTEQPFDLIVVSQSPGYTPASSDKLMDVIKQYIEEI